MTIETPASPVHQQVFERLRDMVLFGELAPGEAVTIQGIADNLGAGMTPVREALRRLVSAGALTLQGNRRVSVPVLSRSDIDEIAHLRQSIEPELARRAAKRVTPNALAVLKEADLALDRALAAGDVAGYLHSNHAFHTLLYAEAKAPILASVADGLWLRFGPSMRVICGRLGTAQLPDQHKAILTALEAKDADTTAASMAEDVAQGIEQLRMAAEPRFD